MILLSFWLAFPQPLIQDSMKVLKAVGWGLLWKGNLCHEESKWPKSWQKEANEQGVVPAGILTASNLQFQWGKGSQSAPSYFSIWNKFRTWLNSYSPLWQRKNSDWASDRLTNRVCLWKWQVGPLCCLRAKLPARTGLSSLSELCAAHACHRRVDVPCSWPEECLPQDSADLKDPPSSIGATQPAIYLSFEGLIGRAPSTDFPQTIKLWNVSLSGCESQLFGLNSSSLFL